MRAEDTCLKKLREISFREYWSLCHTVRDPLRIPLVSALTPGGSSGDPQRIHYIVWLRHERIEENHFWEWTQWEPSFLADGQPWTFLPGSRCIKNVAQISLLHVEDDDDGPRTMSGTLPQNSHFLHFVCRGGGWKKLYSGIRILASLNICVRRIKASKSHGGRIIDISATLLRFSRTDFCMKFAGTKVMQISVFHCT